MRLILGVILVLTSFSLSAQNKAEEKLRSAKSIKALKQGVLLVKLYTDEKKIKALRAKGFEERADQAEADRRKENERVIQAISTHYKFGDYMFFYSRDLKAIGSGDYDGKVVDSAGQVVQVGVDSSHVFVLDTRRVHFKDMGTHQLGYSIMDHRLEQLDRPFPYYVRKRESLSFWRRSHYDMAIKLNKDLDAYHEKVTGH